MHLPSTFDYYSFSAFNIIKITKIITPQIPGIPKTPSTGLPKEQKIRMKFGEELQPLVPLYRRDNKEEPKHLR